MKNKKGLIFFGGVNMSVFDKIKNRLTAKYSDWIRVDDDKSLWTIEDFPYKTGVD